MLHCVNESLQKFLDIFCEGYIFGMTNQQEAYSISSLSDTTNSSYSSCLNRTKSIDQVDFGKYVHNNNSENTTKMNKIIDDNCNNDQNLMESKPSKMMSSFVLERIQFYEKKQTVPETKESYLRRIHSYGKASEYNMIIRKTTSKHSYHMYGLYEQQHTQEQVEEYREARQQVKESKLSSGGKTPDSVSKEIIDFNNPTTEECDNEEMLPFASNAAVNFGERGQQEILSKEDEFYTNPRKLEDLSIPSPAKSSSIEISRPSSDRSISGVRKCEFSSPKYDPRSYNNSSSNANYEISYSSSDTVSSGKNILFATKVEPVSNVCGGRLSITTDNPCQLNSPPSARHVRQATSQSSKKSNLSPYQSSEEEIELFMNEKFVEDDDWPAINEFMTNREKVSNQIPEPLTHAGKAKEKSKISWLSCLGIGECLEY